MIDNINYQLNQINEHQQDEASSCHLLIQVEDLLKPTFKKKFQSKSLDNLQIPVQCQQNDDNRISNTTRTEADLTTIGCENNNNNHHHHNRKTFDNDLSEAQRSQSAPTSPTKVHDKEFDAFIQCEQQQQLITDHFVYNIDLSDTNETLPPPHHQPQSRTAIFFDDDYAPDDRPFEPTAAVNINYPSLINSCLTITEENEEELEQLKRDEADEQQESERNHSHHLLKIDDDSIPKITLYDNEDRADLLENDNDNNTNNMKSPRVIMNQDYDERLSTIYESPSPQPRIEDDDEALYDDTYDKLIVYDVAPVKPIEKSLNVNSMVSSSNHSPAIDQSRIRSYFTDASFKSYPKLSLTPSASNLCGTTTTINSKVFKPPSTLPVFNNNNNNENNSINKSLVNLPIHEQESPSKTSPISLSVPMLLLPTTNEHSTCMMDNNKALPSEHIKKMKIIQSSSSSLSDFIVPPQTSTLKDSIDYEEVSSVHHSLTDCSSIHKTSCCAPIIDENSCIRNKSSDDNPRRPSFTRRILTNGLLLSHCSNSNPTHRRNQPPLTFNQHRYYHQIKPKSEEKLSTFSSPIVTSSSSSSETNSPSGEKFMSRSDFILQQEQQQKHLSQQRKATSLKSISNQSSKIVYPIDFETNHIDQSWYQKHSSSQNKVPTSDSGIVIDTDTMQRTSKSSIEENDVDGTSIDITNGNKLKQYENNYRRTLKDLAIIKKNIVDIESRLSEAMRELEIERALVEGEHEIVFKQILDATESDQQKIRHLYNDLQLLIERIMAEKNSIRNEILCTQQTLFKLEYELRQLEEQYRPSDDKIVKKKELLAQTRKKHEDLEFQLMELETRCEAEIEQAEEHFQNEQFVVTQNSKLRQDTLRDLDHQQNVILHEVILEKDKLEKEKQKLKLLFKQKKFEANELEQKINQLSSSTTKRLNENLTMYHSTPANIYNSLNYSQEISSPKINSKDNYEEKINELKEMIARAKLEKMTILEEQLRERYNELVQSHGEHVKHVEFEDKFSNDYQVKLREKNRMQERPLTRYLPNRSMDFDLRGHIEGAGHLLNSSHIHLTSTSCRGFLLKMGGMKFKTWNRRWFVFDRKRRALFYYQDKTETKLRGCIYFQSILEVYVDHLQSISLRSPEPRQATFIVKTIERPYYLVAPTVETMRIWVDVIITGAEGNTFAGDS